MISPDMSAVNCWRCNLTHALHACKIGWHLWAAGVSFMPEAYCSALFLAGAFIKRSGESEMQHVRLRQGF